MAIDPTTAKAIAMLAKKAIEDEKTRRTILICIMIPILIIFLVIASPYAILFGMSKFYEVIEQDDYFSYDGIDIFPTFEIIYGNRFS